MYLQITPRNCSSYLTKLGMHYEQYKSAFRKLFEPDDNELFKIVFDSGILKWTKVLSEQMSIIYGVFTFNHVSTISRAQYKFYYLLKRCLLCQCYTMLGGVLFRGN